MNRWKKSRDNRGMSLVMVIGTVALVSILVVIVLSLSLMNIQMKSVYKKSADNFYDAEAAMDDNNWKYSLRDLPELLEAVCDYYKKRFDVELTPDMVMTVYGSQEGMGHLGMALCDEGDVVLLPDPCYPVFAAGSLMAGAEPYYYPLVATR